MKKTYQILISIVLIFIAILAFFFWEPLLDFFNDNYLLFFSILINIFAYIVRVILIRIVRLALGTKKISSVAIFVINIIWIVFIFELILVLSPPLGVAIISFLVVSISLTFRERIDNFASGFMLLSSSSFEIGDLIETNDVQGIVTEISLNYTKLRNFMGIITYFPNTNIYNASIKRFTQKISQLSLSEEEEQLKLQNITKDLKGLIHKEDKFTRLVRVVEIPLNKLESNVEEQLSDVFDEYEEKLGIRPIYYANTTIRDRLSFTLQILSKDPMKVVKNTNPFMKDILYALMSEEIKTNKEEDR
ncbi:MAG: mechanosensitive ion channel [Promethearchaeota archaeon]|nr:MAG: mechanosensitive ion channel [Candidatus Lokiarchaeota archaeon]